jgi:UDP-4-amino-4-deoxy-L-arabinose-oxoglutarate aminotransferase
LRNKFLPFSRPSITEADIQAVSDVLRSGWITTGPRNLAFENRFSEYVNADGAVALTSATAGMHLVLKALGIGTGDEVITPSMTWVSTVNLIVLAGAKPVFADIDRDTLMVTADSIKACLSEKTKLIIPVHYAGAPVDLEPIRSLAARYSLLLIEDAAHALGTAYRSEMIGQKGTAIFSFHPIKNITTGEGGMVCSDDPVLLNRIRRLKFHGLAKDAYDRETQGRSPQAEVVEPGYKYNMTDIDAALGLSQLRRVEKLNAKRRELASLYDHFFRDIEEIRPLADPQYPITHARHLYIVRLDIEKAGMSRAEFMHKLKLQNIGTGIHFVAVHRQRYYQDNFSLPDNQLPNTEWNDKRIFSLPLFPDMTSADIKDVVSAVKEILKK